VNQAPRVAFFTDSFHEINGVALTSRQLDSYSRRKQFPFLSVHAGPETRLEKSGKYRSYELKRGPASIALDRDLFFDPFLTRYRTEVMAAVKAFRPDVVHVTGPGDFGILGVWIAHSLRLPLAASWHTNIHEFAARRLEKLLSFVPEGPRKASSHLADRGSLSAVLWFYRKASVCLAPNQELIDLVNRGTGKPTFLMQRGADTTLFSPHKRDPGERPFTLGFVGRLQAEKNVRFLAQIEKALLEAGVRDFRFLIVGGGGEAEWLRENMKQADFPGVLTGEPLARAYANMDLFVFPSFTDTFGNVILEAMASGVPSVVTTGGGPKFLVKSGITGFVAADDEGFIKCVQQVLSDADLHERMCSAARQNALSLSWDETFDRVYQAYETCRAGRVRSFCQAC
jgi:glycosyltransferase involved in cell wall biosynthesis